MDLVNREVAAMKGDKLAFIDIRAVMLGEDGKPKPDIFVADHLHMNAKGYALWVPLVKPYLDETKPAPR
jgi:lysophospholipase L1-like esterase